MSGRASPDFVFIHGWGMDQGVFKDLAAELAFDENHFIDLGFIRCGETNWPDVTRPAVYITHSLGTLWLLRQWRLSGGAPKEAALIALNGFTCFTDFTDPRRLRLMQRGLANNPAAQMADFWRRAGGGFKRSESDLEIETLHKGLDWLREWDEQEALNGLNLPVLALLSAMDQIVPLEAAARQWQGRTQRIHPTASHMLPLEQPEWCAAEIKAFLAISELI